MQKIRKNRVRLADVAQASGVSLTAASLALSDKPGVSQETRDRIIEIAQSMGYRIKVPVSMPKTSAFNTIGLLVRTISGDEPRANQFYSPLLSGIESTARQMGINLLYAHLPAGADNIPLERPALLEKTDIDGLILMGVLVDKPLGTFLENRHKPVVLVDSYAPGMQFNSVLSDNEPAAIQAIEYLIHKGHRHIGFIGGRESVFPSLRERRIGYQRALSKHNISSVYFADCSFDGPEISSAAVDLLKKNPKITAVMGVNDETAIRAMFALIEAGYRVPQDISVIGFDDIYLANTVVPSLTTMSVSKTSMGCMAGQMLVNQIYQAEGCTVTSLFRPVLVERNSVANYRSKS